MNPLKQFREFGVLNSINPLPMQVQVLYYNLMQAFNIAGWPDRLTGQQQNDFYDDFDDGDDDDGFEPCDHCDLPDACADFGCAIKSGVRKDYPIDEFF